MSKALGDIAVERRRQVEEEGWTADHDDKHTRGEMAASAACYALWVVLEPRGSQSRARAQELVHRWWPWNWSWWKPTDHRRDLVKAGALIVAEIERLDRARTEEQREIALSEENARLRTAVEGAIAWHAKHADVHDTYQMLEHDEQANRLRNAIDPNWRITLEEARGK